MANEPDADRVILDSMLKGQEWTTHIWDDGDGTITEEVETETHSFYFRAETGELTDIEHKD
jgi:hypothetical protein